ncbi:MAG: glutathione S-transferase family protein [Gammaproteobacteria bacterium]
MLTLHDFHDSGNGFKIRLLLHFLQRPYRYVEVDILSGASRTPEFYRLNPNGRIPVLQMDDKRALAESNAILFYLAQDTAFFPADPFAQAQIMSWLFFEQYSHEPNIATSRFIRKHRELDETQTALLDMKKAPGVAALDILEMQLAHTDFLVGTTPSIADIALYAYTHVAEEGGFDLQPYPGLNRWLQRIANLPHYVPITHVSGLALG